MVFFDPRIGRPTITAGSDHYIHTWCLYVRPYVRSHFSISSKTNQLSSKWGYTVVITTGGTVGLAKGIIDDTFPQEYKLSANSHHGKDVTVWPPPHRPSDYPDIFPTHHATDQILNLDLAIRILVDDKSNIWLPRIRSSTWRWWRCRQGLRGGPRPELFGRSDTQQWHLPFSRLSDKEQAISAQCIQEDNPAQWYPVVCQAGRQGRHICLNTQISFQVIKIQSTLHIVNNYGETLQWRFIGIVSIYTVVNLSI